MWPVSSISIHAIELLAASEADWRRLYPETLNSRYKDAAETAQAEENFNLITGKLECKLLMVVEI